MNVNKNEWMNVNECNLDNAIFQEQQILSRQLAVRAGTVGLFQTGSIERPSKKHIFKLLSKIFVLV